MIFTKTLSKKEVAQMLDISPGTLSFYLNKKYFKELQKIGYEKKTRLLMPIHLNYLAEKIDLSIEKN